MRGLLVAVVLGVGAVVTAMPAAAQVDCILDPTAPECVGTTTTEAPSTTSTTDEESTTTTVGRTTTTTSTTLDDGDATTTVPPSSTTSLPALLEEGPPTDVAGPVQAPTTTSTTVAPGDAGDDGDETGRQVFLVVTGLLVLAVVFGLLTYWYWRRTRPAKPKPAATTKTPA
jgi:cobalamin biosynthesis Mg chelatase CobN